MNNENTVNNNIVTVDGDFGSYDEFVDFIEELGDDAYDYL